MKTIVILSYPMASQAAVHGIEEAFEVANSICLALDAPYAFRTLRLSMGNLSESAGADVVILPPSMGEEVYEDKGEIRAYLTSMQDQGAILASACAGAFLLAAGGFLDNKACTTHWRMSDEFRVQFPKAKLNESAILVNEGSVITAGGRMAWLDLVFEIIAISASPMIAQHLSKEMVVDSGFREQRFLPSVYSQAQSHRQSGIECSKIYGGALQ